MHNMRAKRQAQGWQHPAEKNGPTGHYRTETLSLNRFAEHANAIVLVQKPFQHCCCGDKIETGPKLSTKTDLLTPNGHIRTETIQLNRFVEHPQSAWGQNRNRIQTLDKPDLLTPDGQKLSEAPI